MQSRRVLRPGFRRGGVYVLVLGSSMLIMLIGLATVAMTQASARNGSQSGDVIEASALAESGVELALSKFAGDSNWQTDYPAGVATTPVALGHGTVSFKWLTATGGVRIYGIGQVHKAKRIYSIKCVNSGAYSSMQSAATGGSISIGGTVNGGPTLSSNGNISASTATFGSPSILQATGSISAPTTNVTKVALSSALAMPDSTHAFDYYTTNGTTIPLTSLAVSGFGRSMTWKLLGPGVNTIAGTSTNALGIYVINCNGTQLTISNCRILGTLVLLNPGAGSTISVADYFAPNLAGYPSLMVQGNLSISISSSTLSDSSANSANFNQAGAPYSGTTDTTYTTSYPSRFEGIVYCSGTLTVSGATFNGIVLANSLSLSGTNTLNYDSSIYNNPPPGFVGTQLTTVPGSWQWETGP